MATRTVSRAGKAQSHPKIDLERMHLELVGVKAAAMTAILALESKGVHADIATSLRRHVYFPLKGIDEALDGPGGKAKYLLGDLLRGRT